MPDQTDALVQSISAKLRERGWTLSVAESLTAGRIQARLTSMSGASEFFAGGVSVYSLESKSRLLSVDSELVQATNGVAAEVAVQMATGVCRLFSTNMGLATTGYAEPSPEFGADKPEAFVALWLAADGQERLVRCEHLRLSGSRSEVQQQVCDTAIALVAEGLQSDPG